MLDSEAYGKLLVNLGFIGKSTFYRADMLQYKIKEVTWSRRLRPKLKALKLIKHKDVKGGRLQIQFNLLAYDYFMAEQFINFLSQRIVNEIELEIGQYFKAIISSKTKRKKLVIPKNKVPDAEIIFFKILEHLAYAKDVPKEMETDKMLVYRWWQSKWSEKDQGFWAYYDVVERIREKTGSIYVARRELLFKIHKEFIAGCKENLKKMGLDTITSIQKTYFLEIAEDWKQKERYSVYEVFWEMLRRMAPLYKHKAKSSTNKAYELYIYELAWMYDVLVVAKYGKNEIAKAGG